MGGPVVASNTTSLPEVVSGKFVLVRPADPEAIAHGVEMVYRKQYMIAKKKTFSWKDVIEGYWKIYQELVRK